MNGGTAAIRYLTLPPPPPKALCQPSPPPPRPPLVQATPPVPYSWQCTVRVPGAIPEGDDCCRFMAQLRSCPSHSGRRDRIDLGT